MGPTSAAPTAAPPLEEIFRAYAPRVHNLARRMLGNEADAEDVTQDVFLQLVRRLPTFRGECAFPTWLHRVTVNAARTYRRRQAAWERHRVVGGDRFPGPGEAVGPEQRILEQEEHQLLKDAIAGLPEPCREVYLLADVQGLDNPTVAGVLGLSLPAVKSRLRRARLLLREILADHFGGTDGSLARQKEF